LTLFKVVILGKVGHSRTQSKELAFRSIYHGCGMCKCGGEMARDGQRDAGATQGATL